MEARSASIIGDHDIDVTWITKNDWRGTAISELLGTFFPFTVEPCEGGVVVRVHIGTLHSTQMGKQEAISFVARAASGKDGEPWLAITLDPSSGSLDCLALLGPDTTHGDWERSVYQAVRFIEDDWTALRLLIFGGHDLIDAA